MTQPMPAWSHSSLTKFETCARQYYLVRVAKTARDVQGEAALWGDRVHKALEERVKNKTPLPAGMAQYETVAAAFDNPKGQVFTETQIALTRNLTKTTWFAKDAWVRGIIDVGVDAGEIVLAADYKTGKVKPDNDQLKLFAGLIMGAKPWVQKVRTLFIWLKDNSTTKKTFRRDELPEIWEEYIVRSERLQNAYKQNKWPAKPSGLCNGWCPATRTQCEFSTKP